MSQIMVMCEQTAWNLIDQELSVNALPFLALLDYLSTDVALSEFYSIRAKIMKAIVLSRIGNVDEAYQ